MPKSVLVTGFTGQVGSALLAQKDIYPFKFNPIGRNEWDMAIDPGKALYLIEKHRPDVVINPAAFTDVDGAEKKQAIAHTVNATAVGELAKACKKYQIPLLHLSTDYVFDGAKKTPYVESDPTWPINVYGKSKLEGERLVRNILQEHIILRTSWIFSDNGKNFVTTMRHLAKEGKELNVVDDQRGGPTYANCVANVLLRITDRFMNGDAIPWGTYHYAGTPSVSWYEFAKAIFEADNVEFRPKINRCFSADYKTKAKRPRNSILMTSKCLNTFKLEACYWKTFL